ncbi:MAG: vitamin K epoxide reductase family protein [Jatrophihabitans sp.]|nr:MAG: vitamin K epoxide reductase family protein [Jatrophihabitans sp.]
MQAHRGQARVGVRLGRRDRGRRGARVMSTAAVRAPARGVASLVIAALGLAISTYLTVEHFTSSLTLACPESAAINCQKVTTSSWSHVGPVPVAVLGLAYFVVMTALCTPWAWRVPALDLVRVAGAVLGVLVALYLVWVELFRVDAICLWCTGVHVCTLLLLGAVLWTRGDQRAG